jgi:glycosyltransferase involved in cell wall biosynthesis
MEMPVKQQQKSLIVEGWRFLPHSYALVNQWQLLALSRRSDVALKVIDLPLYSNRWKRQEGLFDPVAEECLQHLEVAHAQAIADVTLRISFPFDFSPSRSPLTAVFGTCEHQIVRKDQLPDEQAYQRFRNGPPPKNIKAITPSTWSAEGFYRAGFEPEQVIVVPHGVDVETFRPMPELRAQIRKKISIGDDSFVFLSVGAMTGNKGMDILLRAFAEISRIYPEVYLLLKGVDPLYKSSAFLRENMKALSPADRERVEERMIYFGDSFRLKKMAQLYQAAEVYVSPYRAEGFNLPVLEAAASGLPIICTKGGATDDFVTDEFARKIESNRIAGRHDGQEVFRLEPEVDHLIALMRLSIEERSWREAASDAGPRHVRANLTWDHVVDLLLRRLFPS